MTARVAMLAAALLAAASGCSSEYSVALTLRSDPPIEPELSRERAVLAEGTALGVLARGFEDDDAEDADVAVELISSDTGVLDVRPGLDPNEYVLVARRAGTATIDAWVGGEAAAPIAVTVEPQGPAPE